MFASRRTKAHLKLPALGPQQAEAHQESLPSSTAALEGQRRAKTQRTSDSLLGT